MAARADSLFEKALGDSALSILGPAISEARGRRQRDPLLRLLLADARIRCTIGSGPVLAEAESREALLLARAARDTLRECVALRWLGVSLGNQSKTPEGGDVYRELLNRATGIGNREYEGYAWLGIGYDHLLGARFEASRDAYGKAIPIFRDLKLTFWELWSMQGLGRVYNQIGDRSAARRCFEDVVNRSRETGSTNNEATALNNLGVLEFRTGDPSLSIGYFRRALELHRRLGSHQLSAVDMRNIAISLNWLWHFNDAEALLDSLITLCRDHGLRAELAKATIQLGATRLSEKRDSEAARLSREGLALWASFNTDALLVLAQALSNMDSLAVAEQILTDQLDRSGSRIAPGDRAMVEIALGRVLYRLGRDRDAIERLRATEGRVVQANLTDYRATCLTVRGSAFLRLGQRDSARAELDRAVENLEAMRGSRRDRDWRAVTLLDQKLLFTSLADLELGQGEVNRSATCTARAFDALQRIRGRTFYEVMVGPAKTFEPSEPIPGVKPVTLRQLQEVLQPGELFIDTFDGHDEMFLFAVTTVDARAVRLARSDSLVAPRVNLLRRLMERSTAGRNGPGAGDIDIVGGALAEQLFREFGDMLARSPRVFISPDGLLNTIPLGALSLADDRGESGGPILLSHEVSYVPSAGILATFRRRDAERASKPGPPRLLAWAGPTKDASSGIVREVTWLARHFRNVTTRGLPGDPQTSPTAGDLTGFDVIHLAGHSRVDDSHPWESGILISGGDKKSGAVGLTASHVADLKLTADLAVLSGCTSAGGRVLGGEGVFGLTTGFLLSGVPAVVGTLWGVDDRATERLMETFYKRLARGDLPAAALARAQHALRQSREFSHPSYWSPFILVGDGARSVSIE